MKTFKRLLTITISLVFMGIGMISYANVKEKTYCDGWEEGYEQGWCYEIVNCVAPVVPVCPIPKVNQTSYKDGYNRGFTTAKNKRK